MRSIVTGTIAAATGITLLLGGGGSFALWNADASTRSSTVHAGDLALTANPDGVWTDITNGHSDPVDISAVRMVPGNAYQFHQTFDVTATGDDLSADLSWTPLDITGDAELRQAVTSSLAVTSDSAALTPAGRTSWLVRPSAGVSVLDVTATIGLSSDVTTGEDQTIDLSGLTFTLTQKPIED
ncbi:alternate-type signal peptide domain-containing protein [Curtobacterium sp. MCPF17_011]|uniref:alternate-type signal peptide domain-containing protein n=1 Tax=Curtobacterium sp. MCPF17_011 TaxID=2175652 RepID=UPI000DA85424|nr:alternate-type signal peptide domain-containing protein [Curtobacterium sp. MCPF17_011]PZF13789.1 alternate-type signal peptide domain-containing protein [Curtobacterium sp. MCPF17_011]